MKEREAKIKKSFRDEKALRAGKHGIERYFQYDLNNPIDAEIVRRICELSTRKRYGLKDTYLEDCCRRLLAKRLGKGIASQIITDQLLEQELLKRCLKNGKTRNEYVRELFCIQLDIKEGFEVVQTHNPATIF
ncbi:hypothetical protein [Methanosarcina sp.]|uniref:hypothetical protein n=1 Tax=Methanosarcina sp. TaxID=2213 RepID=UPI002D1F9F01|nr:hypothetical protein [Methanosarcina sp.]